MCNLPLGIKNKHPHKKLINLFPYRVCGIDPIIAFHECDSGRDRIYLLQLQLGSAAVWTSSVSKHIKSNKSSASASVPD